MNRTPPSPRAGSRPAPGADGLRGMLRPLLGCTLTAVLSLLLVGASAQAVDALFAGAWFAAAFLPCLAFAAAWAPVTAWSEQRSSAAADTAGLLGTGAGAAVAAVVWLRLGWADTLWLGLLPGPQTFSALGAEAEALRRTVAEQVPPVPVSAGMVGACSAVLVLVLALTLLLARSLRQPALAGAPALLLIVVGAVVTAGATPLPALLLAAAAWLGLLWSARPGPRGQGLPGVLATGVAALLVLFGAGTALPPFTDGLLPEGQRWTSEAGGGRQLDTELDLGEDLRRSPGPTGISLTTDDGAGRYLRAGVVEDVMAETWTLRRPAADAAPARGEIEFPRPALPLTDGQVTVTLERFPGDWIPVPEGARRVPAAEDDWVALPQDGVIARPTPSRLTGSLTLVEARIDAAPEQLAAAAAARPGTDQDPPAADRLDGQERAALAESALARRAEEVVGAAETDWEKANALQAWLRSDEFDYSTTAPVEEDYDGSGLAMTERFLQERSGYCLHFASAFALMAESQGVAARVVVGYAPQPGRPGEPTEVPSTRTHAWPEVYVEGVGWVPFEPTAEIADAPGSTEAPSAADSSDEPSPTASPSASSSPSSEAAASAPAPSAEPAPSASPDPSGQGAQQPRDSDSPAAVLRAAGVVLGVLLLLALIAAAVFGPAWWRRRRRRRRLEGPWDGEDQDRARVLAAWDEVRDTAARAGAPAEATAGETATAAAWAGLVPDLQAEADSVRRAAQWARYAPQGSPAPAAPDTVSAAARSLVEAMDEVRSARRRR